MAKRSGGHFDPGNTVSRYMPSEKLPVLVIVGEPGLGKEVAYRQGGVNNGSSMSFRHDEAVAIVTGGIRRVDPEDAPVEHRHDICDRKARTDVRRTAAMSHLHGPEPNACREVDRVLGHFQ